MDEEKKFQYFGNGPRVRHYLATLQLIFPSIPTKSKENLAVYHRLDCGCFYFGRQSGDYDWKQMQLDLQILCRDSCFFLQDGWIVLQLSNGKRTRDCTFWSVVL